jgi:hypothetical protein
MIKTLLGVVALTLLACARQAGPPDQVALGYVQRDGTLRLGIRAR